MENQFKLILKYSGILNIVGGFICVLFFKKFFQLFYFVSYDKLIHGPLLMNHILIFAFVAIIGVGLFISSGKLSQSITLIKVSAWGKLYASLTWLVSIFKDGYSFLFLVPIVLDAAIAVYFLIALNRLNLNE